jgi:hypothetical protein
MIVLILMKDTLLYILFLFYFVLFETWSHWVAQAGIELHVAQRFFLFLFNDKLNGHFI